MADVLQAVDPVQFGKVQSDKGASLGYMRVGVFNESTPDSVAKALAAFQVQLRSFLHAHMCHTI
jgi:hypothetical protein